MKRYFFNIKKSTGEIFSNIWTWKDFDEVFKRIIEKFWDKILLTEILLIEDVEENL